MSFLIVKCEPLSDQWECDAHRTPMFMCDDWHNLKLDYRFDVYQVNEDNTLSIVKDYETALESGMALYYWDAEDDDPMEDEPTIVKKWLHRTRNDDIPKRVAKETRRKSVQELDNSLAFDGTITWFYGGKYWVYGEFYDSDYAIGY